MQFFLSLQVVTLTVFLTAIGALDHRMFACPSLNLKAGLIRVKIALFSDQLTLKEADYLGWWSYLL